MTMKTALFIHRSVGRNLIQEGNLRAQIGSGVALDDYDNNTGILTRSNGSTEKDALIIPGNNTNPDNLAKLFYEWPALFNLYDLIIIKSCYPNSRIKDEGQLRHIKDEYDSIIRSCGARKKQLLILTSPPLRPLHTTKTEARLSEALANWLVVSGGHYIRVFDFHGTLSETNGRHKGMLKREYRRLLPFDNHPNKSASLTVAPLVARIIKTD